MPSAAPASAPETEDGEPQVRGAARTALGTRNLLRTSYADWETTAATSVLGDERFGDVHMAWRIAPRLSLVDTLRDWLWVGTRLGFRATLGDNYRDERDRAPSPEMFDVPIQVAYRHRFVTRRDGLLLMAGPFASVWFPTSVTSREAELYATTIAGVGVEANVPLMKSAWLNGLFVSAGGSWEHVFSKLKDPSTYRTGVIPREEFSASASYWLNVWGDLTIGNTWAVSVPFYDYAPVSSFKRAVLTTFDASIGYLAGDLVWLGLGYDNTAWSIGKNGHAQSVFYSPYADVYASVTLLLDAVYDRATRPAHPPAAHALFQR